MGRASVRLVIDGELGTVHLPKVISKDIDQAFDAHRVALADPTLRRIVFDLTKVESLTSPGCGFLIAMGMAAQGRGQHVAFNGAVGTVDRVLRQVGVYRRFPDSKSGEESA